MGGKVFKRAVRAESAKVWFEVETESGKVVHFNCNDVIPGGVVLAFAGEDDDKAVVVDPNDADEKERVQQQLGRDALTATKAIFRHAVVKAQQKLFWDMVDGADDAPGVIDIATMAEIAEMLAGEYTARPTGESSDDGQPKTSTGSDSTPGLPVAVVTYSRSTPVGVTT